MSTQERDEAIHRADAMWERVKNASLGEFVECLTAFAMCYRRAVVDGKNLELDIAKIARELFDGIDDEGFSKAYEGEDAEERRAEHARIEAFCAAMKPAALADVLDEVAECWREVLRYDNADRLARFHLSLERDLALVMSPTVHDLVRLDRSNALRYEPVDGDIEAIMSRCAPAVAT